MENLISQPTDSTKCQGKRSRCSSLFGGISWILSQKRESIQIVCDLSLCNVSLSYINGDDYISTSKHRRNIGKVLKRKSIYPRGPHFGHESSLRSMCRLRIFTDKSYKSGCFFPLKHRLFALNRSSICAYFNSDYSVQGAC